MTGGTLGEIFASLSFAGALVAAISFFKADRGQADIARAWQKMAKAAWWMHFTGVLGIIGTLFYLIYTHQYQYHYVWSHSSNELPVYYMISCFWEGQEGSFLLWSFWHVILGSIVMITAKSWRNSVLSVLSSVNLILASMVLGVYIGEAAVQILLVLALLVPAGFLAYRIRNPHPGEVLMSKGLLYVAAIVVAFLTVGLVALGKTGFWNSDSLYEMASNPSNMGYIAYYLLVFGLFGFLVVAVGKELMKKEVTRLPIGDLMAVSMIWVLAFLLAKNGVGPWKVGSTPFILLKDALPNAPIFANNAGFVPNNGNGLNPLLQNYWMVIHPPTLFLGFASTTLPFSFVIAGILRRKYTEWIRPAMPWLIFSAMVLGVGIIMGGYWAYETLNFGGYWNWDPVENSSFVPWLIGVASIHGLLAFRKSGVFLKFAMLMVIGTFLLVLYSTFLTRSGILGDTSVHTFTDLGLSGQLVLLLVFYVLAVVVIFAARWKEMPVRFKEIPLASAEFFLFLGTLTLIFVGLVVIIATSVPVLREVLNTSLSTIRDSSFFYYKWTIWFAILIGLFSSIGQFLYWRRFGKKRIRDAFARPFVIAAVLAMVVMIATAVMGGEFGFESRYREWMEMMGLAESFMGKVGYFVKWLFFAFADEIVLFSALLTVVSNLDILFSLLRRNGRTRTISGGSIAHIGFALMILGILFSSGYEQVLSKNLNPAELPLFTDSEKVDNVVLEPGRPRLIRGFQVTYLGRKEAKPPVSDLEIVEEDPRGFKLAFDDSTGDRYAVVMPKDVFTGPTGEVNLEIVKAFLDDKVEMIQPKLINDRSLYGVKFVPVTADANRQAVLHPEDEFILYPEAEINPNMGLIAHPSRKIFLSRDVYVHVSSIPKDEEEAPKYKPYQFRPAMGDTVHTSHASIVFERISAEDTVGSPFDLIAKAHLKVITDRGTIHEVEPLYMIDPQNQISFKEAYLKDIFSYFLFVGVDPETGRIELQVQEQENPPQDYIVLKAIEKPAINILWLGTFVLTFGFGMAMVRRIRENRGVK